MTINEKFQDFLNQKSFFLKQTPYSEGYLYQGSLELSEEKLVNFVVSLQSEGDGEGLYQIVYHHIAHCNDSEQRLSYLELLNHLNCYSAGAYYFCLDDEGQVFARHIGRTTDDFEELFAILISGGTVIHDAMEKFATLEMADTDTSSRHSSVQEQSDAIPTDEPLVSSSNETQDKEPPLPELSLESGKTPQELAQELVPTGDEEAKKRLVALRRRLSELEEKLPKEKALLAELQAKLNRTQAAYEAEKAFRQVEKNVEHLEKAKSSVTVTEQSSGMTYPNYGTSPQTTAETKKSYPLPIAVSPPKQNQDSLPEVPLTTTISQEMQDNSTIDLKILKELLKR